MIFAAATTSKIVVAMAAAWRRWRRLRPADGRRRARHRRHRRARPGRLGARHRSERPDRRRRNAHRRWQQARPISSRQPPSGRQTGKPSDEMGDFVAGVLGRPRRAGRRFSRPAARPIRAPKLVMFSPPPMAGGAAWRRAAMGPFYCPTDQRDLSRHLVLPRDRDALQGMHRQGLRIPEAYVIAHEVGHHVQNLLGILPKVQRAAAGRQQG